MIRLNLLFLSLLATSCAAAEPRDWNFVQSVGGMAFGHPAKNDDAWLLPVRVDVSGLQAITVKPTRLHSALSCHAVKAETEGSSIYLTVLTGIAGSGRSAACPLASLGNLSPGTYSVHYRNPDGTLVSLQEIVVGR